MKIYAYLREGSWGFIKHCTSRDIFAFTLKNRLCTEAAILNLDIFFVYVYFWFWCRVYMEKIGQPCSLWKRPICLFSAKWICWQTCVAHGEAWRASQLVGKEQLTLQFQMSNQQLSFPQLKLILSNNFWNIMEIWISKNDLENIQLGLFKKTSSSDVHTS